LPPTSTVPPPASPEASTTAPSSTATLSPSSIAVPPVCPPARPETSTWPVTVSVPPARHRRRRSGLAVDSAGGDRAAEIDDAGDDAVDRIGGQLDRPPSALIWPVLLTEWVSAPAPAPTSNDISPSP